MHCPILHLHIPSGATVGIIGGTGSSKTSLIQLISRLYDTTEGSVQRRRRGCARIRFGVVAQMKLLWCCRKTSCFPVPSKKICAGAIKTPAMQSWNAYASLAQADEFIQQFPQKYDTYIERGGSNVSGGQKQRLCIARALLKKPKILILDDSTSAVDTKTDALIRQAFRQEIPDTTKIIIAQRISSVEDADQIFVMEDGCIVERGTHDELVARGGIYREVYDSQTKSREEA